MSVDYYAIPCVPPTQLNLPSPPINFIIYFIDLLIISQRVDHKTANEWNDILPYRINDGENDSDLAET